MKKLDKNKFKRVKASRVIPIRQSRSSVVKSETPVESPVIVESKSKSPSAASVVNVAQPGSSTPSVNKMKDKRSLNDSGYDCSQLSPVHVDGPTQAHVDGTPPLCECGRRSRKRQVYKIGPNTGRTFWSCCIKGRNTTAGCNFFSWASDQK